MLTAADRHGEDRAKRVEIGGDELILEMREHAAGAEAAKIEVEIGMDRHEVADIDPGGAPVRAAASPP